MIRTGILLAALALAACQPKTQPEAGPPAAAMPAFRDAAEETGLRFVHENDARGQYLMPEIMGAGAALFDMDGDGSLDVYLVQSVGAGKLYRNELTRSGKLSFTDVTAASGITYSGYGMGAATGDIDNDGDPDLLITGWGSRALYRNEGGGRFTEIALPPPPAPHQWFTSASFFDADRDGDLDLIILSYVNFTRAGNKRCQAPTGEPDYCTPRAYSPVAARYYRNEGKGRFADATTAAGIDQAQGPGLGVAAADLNNDGWPDLFVANDTAANHLWINQKNGTFKEAGLEAGAAYSEDGLAKAGMGVAVGDSDGDGDEDLLVVNLMREGATLYRNDGRSRDGLPAFVDATRAAGLYPVTFNFTGFGAGWLDFDNDGALDLFIANGAVTLREEQRGKPRPFAERNLLVQNGGQGRFQDVTDARGGAAFARAGIYRGAAFGDLDNDGDVDLVVTENGGPARLLLNESAVKGLTVELLAPVAVGAMVTVQRKGRPALIKRMHTDSSYCSASDPRLHFGLGQDAVVEQVEVRWPDGTRQVVANPPRERRLVIRKP